MSVSTIRSLSLACILGGATLVSACSAPAADAPKAPASLADAARASLAVIDGMSLHADQVSLTSQPGGGIYRKGHLNERAFSYSIRQEHRSRSYSSLAGLGAGPGYLAGGPEDLRAHDKKERELIQMVHDLELSGDDLERSEVPLAMYPHHHRQQPR